MKHILMLATGGTIACTPTENGLTPALSADELLACIPALSAICTVETMQLCNIDSTDMTPAYWQLIVRTIEEHYTRFDGFVICHGTDTLAYTAAALSYMIQHSPKPIVLTGAQRPITAADTDAAANLSDSLLYACHDTAHNVSVVFGGIAIAGTRARKMYTKADQAFESVNFPALASIMQGKVFPAPVPHTNTAAIQTPQFYHTLHSSIFILKLLPGMQPDFLSKLFADYDCIVIEGFGMGGVPDTLLPALLSCLSQYDNKILAMATQVPFEGTNMQTYAVGNRLKSLRTAQNKCHIIELYDMTLEAAVLKLMWLMANRSSFDTDIASMFYQPVNHDITIL